MAPEELRLARPIPSAALRFVRSGTKHSFPLPFGADARPLFVRSWAPSKENSSGRAETSTATPSDSTNFNSDKYARRLDKNKVSQSPTTLYPVPLSQYASPPTLVSSLHSSPGRWANKATCSLWMTSTQRTGPELSRPYHAPHFLCWRAEMEGHQLMCFPIMPAESWMQTPFNTWRT